MSAIDTIRKGLIQNTVIIPAGQYRDLRQPVNGMWFFGKNGYDLFFRYDGHQSSLTAYEKCPPLTAVINKKAQAFINGRTSIVNLNGKAKGKESNNEAAVRLRKLFTRPNPLQSWKQFEAQAYIYQQLFGYTILLPIKPVGFDATEAKSLWNIPPFMVNIEETNKLFYQSDTNGIIKRIVLEYKDELTTLQASDIYMLKDFTPSFDSIILPESRVCSLEMPINNIIGAYESRNTLINFRGAQGFLSQDKDPMGNLPFDPKDKQQLQEDFATYGLRRGQYQVIISNAMLKWQQMGYPTKDLMLFEEIEDSCMRICDGYNFPYRLMASEKGNSLGGSDVKTFQQILYQDGIIPDAESLYEQLNQFFETDKYGIVIQKDYKHVAALQEDQVNIATARFQRNRGLLIEFQNNLITLNEWRTLNGDEPITDTWGGFYYHQLVAAGIVFGSGQAGSNVPDNVNPSSSTSTTATSNNQQ